MLGKMWASLTFAIRRLTGKRIQQVLSRMYGDIMMNKQVATEIQQDGLRAIEHLSLLLIKAKDRCSSEMYEQIRKGVGLSIGRIQTELLDVIYAEYPELDHLGKA